MVCGVASLVVCGEPLACEAPRGVGTAARGSPAGDRELSVEDARAARRHRSFEILLVGIDQAPEQCNASELAQLYVRRRGTVSAGIASLIFKHHETHIFQVALESTSLIFQALIFKP